MKQFFLILSGLALLTGCSSKNDSVEGPVQSRIRIAPSISRVTGLNFDTGDRIGLTIVKSGANYCENTPLRFDGTVFVSDDLFWYDDSSEKSNLTAYYPYLAEGAPASFTVRADQKLAAGHEASGLLAAAGAGGRPLRCRAGSDGDGRRTEPNGREYGIHPPAHQNRDRHYEQLRQYDPGSHPEGQPLHGYRRSFDKKRPGRCFFGGNGYLSLFNGDRRTV